LDANCNDKKIKSLIVTHRALSRDAQVALIEIYFDTVNGSRNKDAPCCERRT
ncbi:hypothetical protein T07_3438, partial [Trichinella nelsoni]